MVTIFIYNETLSCLPLFIKSASTLLITTFFLFDVCLWIEYDNVVLHRLPIFGFHLNLPFTLRRIPRTSNQMYTGYTFGIDNHWQLCVKSSMTDTRIKPVHSYDLNEGYTCMSLWNLSCRKINHSADAIQ